jgi:heme/copper-type cytochrome/quinol oxidase subunit 2
MLTSLALPGVLTGEPAVIPEGSDEVTVEFVADKPGAFSFACAEYCGSGHGRMKGRLVVNPKPRLRHRSTRNYRA